MDDVCSEGLSIAICAYIAELSLFRPPEFWVLLVDPVQPGYKFSRELFIRTQVHEQRQCFHGTGHRAHRTADESVPES
jgi:hypothetical protein